MDLGFGSRKIRPAVTRTVSRYCPHDGGCGLCLGMGECVHRFEVRGQGDKIDPDQTPKLALAAMMADRISCVH